jgi:hypothetical protein
LLLHRAEAQTRPGQASDPERLDLSVWLAGETGEENTDSFAEAQVWSAGVFVGWADIAEGGTGWRQGNLEYGFNLIPAVVETEPRHILGGGFEPIVLRWNSSHHLGRVDP